jgi:plasmid stabilization system protein ParE
MIDLVICSAAEGEYAEALAWYAERSVQAAERFDADFDLALEKISSDPGRFPRCDERHHFYLMRHFPYQIIYRQHQDHLVVIAVAHTARKPRYWSGR